MLEASDKDLEDWYPISREEFRAWLESKEETTVVGRSSYYGDDPIATALVEKEDGFETAVIDSGQSYTRLNNWMTVTNPRWVNIFIEEIDKDTLGGNITAKKALKVLSDLERKLMNVVSTERLQEIEKAKSLFSTDRYSMSVGELLSLYEEGELVFSNVRYTPVTQQNEFIESIFLELPSQPLFVEQEREGKWRVLSGSWMLKAILNFLDESEKDRLVLRATELLPCLYGLTWDDLSIRERLLFKSFKFTVHILTEKIDDKLLRDKVDSIFRRYRSYD